jgi:hypothetical protein
MIHAGIDLHSRNMTLDATNENGKLLRSYPIFFGLPSMNAVYLLCPDQSGYLGKALQKNLFSCDERVL